MNKIAVLVFCLSVFACSSHPAYTTVKKQEKNYAVFSYYDHKYHGRKTANGEVYNENAATGAHKTLPFNTKVRVYTKDEKKHYDFRINDRGPFVQGRDFDVSYSLAKKLELLGPGVQKLKYELLP